MLLIEREGVWAMLQQALKNIAHGEGHCMLVCGEAGIGKSSVIKAFCKVHEESYPIYRGVCDSLFTPRPLAPLYDVMWQVNNDPEHLIRFSEDRSALFAGFFRDLAQQRKKCIIVFEDIHWADEATLDFIKFFVRRVSQLPCLFIATYRDNEIHFQHPLRQVLGQLPADSFTKTQLLPLSREAVKNMAIEKGFDSDEVFALTGGNPFYVSEILSSYSLGVPENIKDAILSAYHRTSAASRQVWELLSVIPYRLEVKYLEKFDPGYAVAVEDCLQYQILIVTEGRIHFKHELFRRTIENALSPLKRITLNKVILQLLEDNFVKNEELERVVHHAKNANEYDKVLLYAPSAAKRAASVGAHVEAAKLYLSAIEYYQGTDKILLAGLYEAYAYECYLTNQTKEAIIFASKALHGWEEKQDKEKVSSTQGFLSWLWWINDNLAKAEAFAKSAVEVLENEPTSTAKASAYSNRSLLKMFLDMPEEGIYWGEQAIAMAKELDDHATLSDALGNVGAIRIRIPAQRAVGEAQLQQSLTIALQYSFHEYAAKAYTNLCYSGIIIKDNKLTGKYLAEGIQYCEENDLDLWVIYLHTVDAKWQLDKGHWEKAAGIADKIFASVQPTKIVTIFLYSVLTTVKMRRDNKGNPAELLRMLNEAKQKAFETMELQRIIQALSAFLEYEWITGQQLIDDNSLHTAIEMTASMGNIYANSELAFWLRKARNLVLVLPHVYEGYDASTTRQAQKAASIWRSAGFPYNEALLLLEGNTEDKKKALGILKSLGADAVYDKMKADMRAMGIKNIPRGIRKSTQANPLFLTDRELDILHSLKDGLQNKEIGQRLFISVKTVDHHISSILFKLQVKTRTSAVSEALRLQIMK